MHQKSIQKWNTVTEGSKSKVGVWILALVLTQITL